MAKIKPPAFNTRNSISGFVAWTELEQSGLLSLLELPRNEQVMIVQYKYPWFKPKGWVKPKDTKYTKKWWDSLTGDQQTVRWALARNIRAARRLVRRCAFAPRTDTTPWCSPRQSEVLETGADRRR